MSVLRSASYQPWLWIQLLMLARVDCLACLLCCLPACMLQQATHLGRKPEQGQQDSNMSFACMRRIWSRLRLAAFCAIQPWVKQCRIASTPSHLCILRLSCNPSPGNISVLTEAQCVGVIAAGLLSRLQCFRACLPCSAVQVRSVCHFADHCLSAVERCRLPCLAFFTMALTACRSA